MLPERTKQAYWQVVFCTLFMVISAIAITTVCAVAVCTGCSVLPHVQQPSTTSGDVTQTPQITADEIQTAVQTALTNTSTTINDLWPVAAILLVGLVGLIVNNYVVGQKVERANRNQTVDHSMDLGQLERRLKGFIKLNGNGVEDKTDE